MNFKTLAQFVLVAGLAVFGYGAFTYLNADTRARQAMKGASQSWSAPIVNLVAAQERESAQGEAKSFLFAGVCILFVGAALSASASAKGPGKGSQNGSVGAATDGAHRPVTEQRAQNSSTPDAAGAGFCGQCGASRTPQAAFCGSCGKPFEG